MATHPLATIKPRDRFFYTAMAVVAASLVFAGFARTYYRRQPQTHKRLMLVATFALLPAAVGRLPLAFIQNGGELVTFGVNDLFLLACIAYDTLAHRRLHPAYLWAGSLLIVSHPARMALGGTSAWLAFAHWLTR